MATATKMMFTPRIDRLIDGFTGNDRLMVIQIVRRMRLIGYHWNRVADELVRFSHACLAGRQCRTADRWADCEAAHNAALAGQED